MPITKGSRVGAIINSLPDGIRFLGYGVYLGDEVPPEDINPWLNIGRPNPKIQLDNGKVVWGCECWWGPEDKIKKAIEGRSVLLVDIDECRKERE